MDIEEQINSVRVSAEELLEATNEVQKLPEDSKNWEGRTHILVKIFKGQPHKAMSVDSRLTAMSTMIDSGKLPGWALPEQEDGSFNVAEPVWQAAASEKLKFINNLPCFDEGDFLESVLSYAMPEGNA